MMKGNGLLTPIDNRVDIWSTEEEADFLLPAITNISMTLVDDGGER